MCHLFSISLGLSGHSLLNICKPSKERARTRKDYVISREITTLLKIAVENVIL